jgi:histidinol-phosphate aminotransferase
MSRFLSSRWADLEPYIPGEQPRDRTYVKLNTNESPYPPPASVVKAVAEQAAQMERYPDPDSTVLTKAAAEHFGLLPENILMTNGSDETLNFAFLAFGDRNRGFAASDVTYGYYRIAAEAGGVRYTEIPLKEDFRIDTDAFCETEENVVIANPGAPTGIPVPREDLERILQARPDRIVLVDEAYVDFGGESSVPLLARYDNLLIVQTFSKFRSLAGGRIGMGLAGREVISELLRIKNAFAPYNISRIDAAAGLAAFAEEKYYRENSERIAETRERTAAELTKRGFAVLPSRANFLFVRPNFLPGRTFYEKMKEKGVLVRHWDQPRIADWCRITIGTPEQMKILLEKADELKGEAET